MNHIAIPARRFFDILPNRLPIYSESISMQHSGFSHFSENRGKTASVVEILHQIFAGGLKVHEAGQRCSEPFEVVERERHTDAACDCDEMNDSVRRSAD